MTAAATNGSVAAAFPLDPHRTSPYMPTKKIAVSRKRTAIEEESLRSAADKFGKQGYQATTLNLVHYQIPEFPDPHTHFVKFKSGGLCISLA